MPFSTHWSPHELSVLPPGSQSTPAAALCCLETMVDIAFVTSQPSRRHADGFCASVCGNEFSQPDCLTGRQPVAAVPRSPGSGGHAQPVDADDVAQERVQLSAAVAENEA